MWYRICAGMHGRHLVACGWRAGLFAVVGWSCSPSSRGPTASDQLQQLCVDICTKAGACGDAGASASACGAECAEIDAQASPFAPGCNVNQLVSAENACLQDSCSTYASCIEDAAASAACEPSNPSMPADGGASCSLCDQAQTCCTSVEALFDAGDASDCAGFTTAACNGAGAMSSTFADQCQLQLTVGQDYGIAACK